MSAINLEAELRDAEADLAAAREQVAHVRRGLVEADAWVCRAQERVAKAHMAMAPPVDRSQRVLTDGSPVSEDHRELKENGQQKGYVVLSDAERAKGFVRPVRRTYIHLKCSTTTTMGRAIAETYARDPYFYSGTFCCACGAHFPVGEDGEFVWEGTDEKVGT